VPIYFHLNSPCWSRNKRACVRPSDSASAARSSVQVSEAAVVIRPRHGFAGKVTISGCMTSCIYMHLSIRMWMRKPVDAAGGDDAYGMPYGRAGLNMTGQPAGNQPATRPKTTVTGIPPCRMFHKRNRPIPIAAASARDPARTAYFHPLKLSLK